VSHVNIVKKIKVDGDWKLLSTPRNAKGNYDWNALPDGLNLIEWRAGGKRRRESAGVTAAQALEAQRRKRHELEGRKLGVPGFELAGETPKTPALHVAVHKYLAQIEALKKPNTHRKYEAVLGRLVEFFRDKESIDQIGADDLTRYIIALKKVHNLGANTILHNAIIVAQFFKRQGRGRITRELQLPERITPLPRECRTADLAKFFKAADGNEKVLFSTYLLTELRELEVVHLFWTDISLELQTVRVTAKPELGFYPKRWEEREVPIPVQMIDLLKAHPRRSGCSLVFSSPRGNGSTTCSIIARLWQSARGARSYQIRPEDISIYVRVTHASGRLRRPNSTALDGAQIARNDNAISGPLAGSARSPRPSDRPRD
jgi:hypothetical protein